MKTGLSYVFTGFARQAAAVVTAFFLQRTGNTVD